MMIEERRNEVGYSDKLLLYDPDSEFGRLAANGQCLVKIRFRARPTISDYTFKSFKVSK